ncbi:Hypothetical predicted protein [Podarcis lilfordi]|uniref:Uncharacterized protein n=1 Tax=Podarcis lilfordi TaxID=74358 RepID=A0AA35NVW1_9SAUR|nr:Hypothetical predicted protein [Podarcis lilfordi]
MTPRGAPFQLDPSSIPPFRLTAASLLLTAVSFPCHRSRPARAAAASGWEEDLCVRPQAPGRAASGGVSPVPERREGGRGTRERQLLPAGARRRPSSLTCAFGVSIGIGKGVSTRPLLPCQEHRSPIKETAWCGRRNVVDLRFLAAALQITGPSRKCH